MFGGRGDGRAKLLQAARSERNVQRLPLKHTELPRALELNVGDCVYDTFTQSAKGFWSGIDQELFDYVANGIQHSLQSLLASKDSEIYLDYELKLDFFVPKTYGQLYDFIAPGENRSRRPYISLLSCPNCRKDLLFSRSVPFEVGGKQLGRYEIFLTTRKAPPPAGGAIVPGETISCKVTYLSRYSFAARSQERIIMHHQTPAEIQACLEKEGITKCNECVLPTYELYETILLLMNLGIQMCSLGGQSFVEWATKYFRKTREGWQRALKQYGPHLPKEAAERYATLGTLYSDSAITINVNMLPKHLQPIVYLSALQRSWYDGRYYDSTALLDGSYVTGMNLVIRVLFFDPMKSRSTNSIKVPLILSLSNPVVESLKKQCHTYSKPYAPKVYYTIDELIDSSGALLGHWSEYWLYTKGFQQIEARISGELLSRQRARIKSLLLQADIPLAVKKLLFQLETARNEEQADEASLLESSLFPILLNGPNGFKSLLLLRFADVYPRCAKSICSAENSPQYTALFGVETRYVVNQKRGPFFFVVWGPGHGPRLVPYRERKGGKLGATISELMSNLGFPGGATASDEQKKTALLNNWQTFWRKGTPLEQLDKLSAKTRGEWEKF